jgi:hypothetical protein
MIDNKRQFPRKEEPLKVELIFPDDNPLTAISRNYSQGGLYIQLDNPEHYPMGEMVNLRFNNPFENNTETEKDAIIVRHSDDGIAVAFIEIDDF